MSWPFGNDDPFKVFDEIFKSMEEDSNHTGFIGGHNMNPDNMNPDKHSRHYDKEDARSIFLIDPRHKNERNASHSDEEIVISNTPNDFNKFLGSKKEHTPSRNTSIFDQLLGQLDRSPSSQFMDTQEGFNQESVSTSWNYIGGNSVKREERVVGGNKFVTITTTDRDGNVETQQYQS